MTPPITVPAGYTVVAPWIVTTATGQLLDFITAAFDGEELARVPLEDGSIGHAEIRVGDVTLLAFDRRDGWPDTPSMLRVFVTDADATVDRAVAAGARVVTQPRTHAFGQRGAACAIHSATSGGSARSSKTSVRTKECDGSPSPRTPRR